MTIRAKLRIVLHADETVVAESEDASLWQRVLIAINGGALDIGSEATKGTASSQVNLSKSSDKAASPLELFASELGLSKEEVQGACSPSNEAPYMHLDVHCWEAMKKQTPERGPTAYSSMAVAATLLALWFRSANLGSPTQAQAQAVLGTIGIKDQNAARGIERSEWLQARPGGAVVLNPAKVSQAISLAKAFCSKKWSKDAE